MLSPITKRRINNVVTALLVAYVAYVLIARMAQEKAMVGRVPTTAKVEPVGSAPELPRVNIAYVFWATWCGPCEVELSRLSSAVRSGELDPKHIVAVSIDESREALLSYLRKSPLPFGVYWDQDSFAFRSLGLVATPSTVVLDEEGKVMTASTGLSLAPAKRIRDHLSR